MEKSKFKPNGFALVPFFIFVAVIVYMVSQAGRLSVPPQIDSLEFSRMEGCKSKISFYRFH